MNFFLFPLLSLEIHGCRLQSHCKILGSLKQRLKLVQNNQNIPKQKSFRRKVIHFFQLPWIPKVTDFYGNLFDMIKPHCSPKEYSTVSIYILSILFSEFSEKVVTALRYLDTIRSCKLQAGDLKQTKKFLEHKQEFKFQRV